MTSCDCHVTRCGTIGKGLSGIWLAPQSRDKRRVAAVVNLVSEPDLWAWHIPGCHELQLPLVLPHRALHTTSLFTTHTHTHTHTHLSVPGGHLGRSLLQLRLKNHLLSLPLQATCLVHQDTLSQDSSVRTTLTSVLTHSPLSPEAHRWPQLWLPYVPLPWQQAPPPLAHSGWAGQATEGASNMATTDVESVD